MTDRELILSGDGNVPAMPLTDAEVNHLRRLLAWMRCEWTLDPHSQAGHVEASAWLVEAGYQTPEEAGQALTELAEKINKCPKYVRQAVKMLTKKLRDHEARSRVIDAALTTGND